MICGMCEKQFESDQAMSEHLEVCRENITVSGRRDSPPMRAIGRWAELLRFGRDAYDKRYGKGVK